MKSHDFPIRIFPWKILPDSSPVTVPGANSTFVADTRVPKAWVAWRLFDRSS